MKTKQISLGKHFWGLGTSFIAMLAGGWLMVAPYALGFQAYGAAWDDPTKVSFWTGLAVLLVALASLAAFVSILLDELRQVGVIQRQPKVVQPEPEPAPVPGARPTGGAADDDFERAMVTLASALAEEMAARHQGQSGRVNQEQGRAEIYQKPVERSQS